MKHARRKIISGRAMKPHLAILICGLCLGPFGAPSRAQTVEAAPAASTPKSKAFQFSATDVCDLSSLLTAGWCEADFKPIGAKETALITNISCLFKGERAWPQLAQAYAVSGSAIMSVISLKIQHTGSAGAGEKVFYTSNDAVTFYVRGGQSVRVHIDLANSTDPAGEMTCSISGRFL
jgi:hypothetical protein